MTELSDLIKQYVNPLVDANNGWCRCRCMVCDDHQPGSTNFKGLRGNFNFDDSVPVLYSCFNCDHKAYYMSDNDRFSNDLIKVLDSFGIPKSEYSKILLDSFGKTNIIKSNKPSLNLNPIELKLPDHFYKLKDADPTDKWTIIAEHYLKSRLIDSKYYDFYLSTGIGKYADKWKGRIIIPIFKDGKIVFYQGRALLDSMIKKYEGPSVEKNNVIYNYDEIMTYSKKPIFVVEGFFDAYLINGVALMGKNITKEQIEMLNKSQRLKVVIPDREGDGRRIALQAIKQGWSVSCPNFGICKDINDAYIKYGKIYVVNEIMTNIHSGEKAKLMINLYCKK